MRFDKTKKWIRKFGFDLIRYPPSNLIPVDFDDRLIDLLNTVKPYTMTSPERLYGLSEAIKYISRSGIEGSIVECGVWRGGSTLVAIQTLAELGDIERSIYLYDTFEGMPPPTEFDVDVAGTTADEQLKNSNLDQKDTKDSIWCYADIADVKSTLRKSSYPQSNIQYIKGKVEDTIPEHIPSKIAVLRLDTDWYESTKHEMVHLFPRIVSGGVLIIDDYGHWQGAKQAVDEYLQENNIPILLNRLDYTGRIAVVR